MRSSSLHLYFEILCALAHAWDIINKKLFHIRLKIILFQSCVIFVDIYIT